MLPNGVGSACTPGSGQVPGQAPAQLVQPLPHWLLDIDDHGEVMTAGNPVAQDTSVMIRTQIRDAWFQASRMSNDGDPAAQRSVNEALLKVIELGVHHDMKLT